MSTKRGGTVSKIQREIDTLKFKIDDLCENELPSLGVSSPDRTSAYRRAAELKEDLTALDKDLDNLSLVNSKLSTPKFNEQKGVEKKRVKELQKKLNNVSHQLEPDEVEEDYFRAIDQLGSHQSQSIMKSPDKTPPDDTKYVKFKRKEEQKESDHYEDEEVEDEEEDDEDDYEDEDEEEEDEDEEDDEIKEDGDDNEELQEKKDKVIYRVEALSDFVGEQPDDLSFETGDILEILDANEDGWWFGRDSQGKKGLVPSTLVKIMKGNSSSPGRAPLEKRKSGKELWAALRESKTEKMSVTDVLQAMKAIPSGFRAPTLGAWYRKDEHRASSWIIPKTSQSNLQLRDLFWDAINKKLKSRSVKLCRTFSLMSVRCIPPVGAGVEILSRHVYVALWDQDKVISNIHLVRAVHVERDQSWAFTPKIGKNVPSLYDGDFLVRINQDDRKISLLIELNFSYRRTSTGEKSDICCGWASLPLFDAEGAPVGNKNFELQVIGGTPFERGIPLDSSISFNPNQSMMQSLIRSNRQPRILVKATSYNKLTKETYDMLPDTLVTCQQYSPFVKLYRQHAALLLCREDTVPTQLMCDSIMSYFPRALNFPDLMDALKQVWDERNRVSLNRSQRKNLATLYNLFKECFNDSIFSLMQCADLPSLIWADEQVEKARNTFIAAFIQRRNVIGGLLSADYRFKPMNINKLAFDVVSKHSIEVAPICKDNQAVTT